MVGGGGVRKISFQSSMVDIIKNREYDRLKIQTIVNILNEKLQLLSKIHANIPPRPFKDDIGNGRTLQGSRFGLIVVEDI